MTVIQMCLKNKLIDLGSCSFPSKSLSEKEGRLAAERLDLTLGLKKVDINEDTVIFWGN